MPYSILRIRSKLTRAEALGNSVHGLQILGIWILTSRQTGAVLYFDFTAGKRLPLYHV